VSWRQGCALLFFRAGQILRISLESLPQLLKFFFAKQNLKDAFANKIPIWKKEQKELVTKYGDKILGTCTVEQAYGGMRSVKSMVYETSLLDPVEVLFFFFLVYFRRD
jgi:hypothetical protein